MFIDEDVRPQVEAFLTRMPPNMGTALGITFTHVGRDRVVAVMPVDERTRQPMGLLHGGASVALAETVASVGAWLNVDPATKSAVGLEINANHLRAVREGIVTATATPVHRGATTQVWEIRITTSLGKLVCMSRCTLAIIDKPRA
jgi:1,4-dihydroxy-2-naphthoyl-CoA hydrolase